jgi:hypothetical protein
MKEKKKIDLLVFVDKNSHIRFQNVSRFWVSMLLEKVDMGWRRFLFSGLILCLCIFFGVFYNDKLVF